MYIEDDVYPDKWDTLIMANGISLSVRVTQYVTDDRCFVCNADKLLWVITLPTKQRLAIVDPTYDPNDGGDCEHMEVDHVKICKVCAKTISHMLRLLLEGN